MDRKVLLATSVLSARARDTPTWPYELLPKVILGFIIQNPVARARDEGFGSLASELTDKGAKPTRTGGTRGQGPPQEPPRQPRDAPARPCQPKGTWRRWSRFRAQQYSLRRCPAAARRSTAPGRRGCPAGSTLESGARRGGHVQEGHEGGKIIGACQVLRVLDMKATSAVPRPTTTSTASVSGP